MNLYLLGRPGGYSGLIGVAGDCRNYQPVNAISMEKDVKAVTVRGGGEKRAPRINESVRLVEVRSVPFIKETDQSGNVVLFNVVGLNIFVRYVE